MILVKEERLQILQMLKEGKVTVEEANSLLEALGSQDAGQRPGTDDRSRFLRIRVVERGKQRVNVNLPIELVRVASRWIPTDLLKEKGHEIDWEEVIRMVQEGAQGKLIEVMEDDGTLVEIIVQ